MEHRCGFRRAISMPVILRTREGFGANARICDISSSGALIRSRFRASPHSLVQIQFRDPDTYERLTLSAEVVRLTQGGFAVEWADFSPPAVRSIIRQLSGEAMQSFSVTSIRVR